MRHLQLSAMIAVAGLASTARADGPGAVGRAGAATVGDDGGAALLVDPASIARRTARRVQVGLTFVDDAVNWHGTGDAIVERDQAGARAAPMIAVAGGLGDYVLAAAVMTSAVSARSLPSPVGLAPAQFAGGFDARYAGLVGALRRDTVTIGAARRLGDSVAIGVSVAGSRIAVTEDRSVWAGMAGRDTVGDPQQDVALALGGHDGFAPSAVAGVMIAPAGTRLELGASVGWAATAHVSGTVIAAGTDGGPSVAPATVVARLDVPQPWTFRAGARWVGDRWSAELDGDLWLFRASAASTSWQLDKLEVSDPDGTAVALGTLPSRLSAQTHGAVRGSVDLELIHGLVWATAGYAYTTAGTDPARLSPTFGQLPGHTGALGVVGVAGGFTLTLGWSRTWEVASSAASALGLDNPFGGAAGTSAVPAGRYDGSIDQVGALLDIELGAP